VIEITIAQRPPPVTSAVTFAAVKPFWKHVESWTSRST